jgi:phosphoglycerate dehydrogenase-like enzyme
MLSIAILDDYQNVALELADWSVLGPDARITVHNRHIADADELVGVLQDAEVVVLMRERTAFPRSVIERLPQLRLIVTSGMRNPAIDLVAAQARGIMVCGTEYHDISHSTVELTWGLILAQARDIARQDASVRQGDWQLGIGRQLHGRTLGVVGLGRLGTAVARIGAAFGMKTLAWSPNLTAERAAAAGVEMAASKLDLMARADVVSLHLVLSERTRHIIDGTALAAMKPDGVLINTARGPLVDTAALLAALEAGSIGGAAIDVYDAEPLPPAHPLRTAPRTVLTPHLGYVTREQYQIYYSQIVEDIAAFEAGRPLRQLAVASTNQKERT